jgi:transposase
LKIVGTMELITILNHCHRHRGFVYQHARFAADQQSIEVDGRARRRSVRGATSRHRVTIIFPSGASSSFRCGAFSGFPAVPHATRGVPHCGVLVEEVPWCDGKHQLTRAYMQLLARWARKLSWKETAEAFHTSWDKVGDGVEYVVGWGLEHRTLQSIRAIGVDEIH